LRLDEIAKKTHLHVVSENQDICAVLFSHVKTQKACRIFIDFLKKHDGRVSPHQVSKFSFDLECRKDSFSYSQRNFYKTVFRRLVEFGFITKFYIRSEGWLYRIQDQPITERPPGGRNFWNLSWQICKKWNDEFM